MIKDLWSKHNRINPLNWTKWSGFGVLEISGKFGFILKLTRSDRVLVLCLYSKWRWTAYTRREMLGLLRDQAQCPPSLAPGAPCLLASRALLLTWTLSKCPTIWGPPWGLVSCSPDRWGHPLDPSPTRGPLRAWWDPQTCKDRGILAPQETWVLRALMVWDLEGCRGPLEVWWGPLLEEWAQGTHKGPRLKGEWCPLRGT